jgi:hypothetical protein
MPPKLERYRELVMSEEAKALARQLLEFSPPQEVPTYSMDYSLKYSLILFQRGHLHLGPLVKFRPNKRKQIENQKRVLY